MAKILYLEDNKDLRVATTRVLTQLLEHSVICREDTNKVDALVDQWRPDLVITDHELGEGKEKGLELAKRLHANGHKVAILSASPEAFNGAAKAKIPFFYKPYHMVALLKEMGVET